MKQQIATPLSKALRRCDAALLLLGIAAATGAVWLTLPSTRAAISDTHFETRMRTAICESAMATMVAANPVNVPECLPPTPPAAAQGGDK